MTEPELPHELVRLFAAERQAPGAAPGVQAAVRAKLAASFAHGAFAGLGIGKLVVIVALAIGAGAATVATLRSDERAGAAAPRLVHAAVELPAPATSVPAAPVAIQPAPRDPASAPPPSRRHAAHVHTVSSAVAKPPVAPAPARSQAQLVRAAWLALGANDARHALTLADDDSRLHPHGPLDEERDAIRVVALARLGHFDDARAAASTFLARYPTTVHRELVTRAINPEPRP